MLLVALGVALAVVPSLPLVTTESVVFERFHNWALFTGGLLLGWELRTIRRDLTAER